MANGLVIHIEVGAERHTDVLSSERIRIGTDPDCAPRLQPDLFAKPPGLLLELLFTDGHYRVADFNPDLAIMHNDRPLRAGGAIIDGDRVQLPAADLTLRFFPLSGPPALVVDRRRERRIGPFVEDGAAVEAATTARRDDAKVFLREFTRELVREIRPSTKLIILLFALALVGGTLYLGYAAYKELKQSRRQIEAQNQQIGALNRQIRDSQEQFEKVDRSNKDIIYSMSLAPKLRSDYGSGVCLIAGTYVFVESGTGRPLRYPEAQPTPADESAPPENEQAPLLTPEGRGPVAEFPYVGTGFHVGDGYVVTNRHVAVEPWVADERSMIFSSSVNGRPRLTKLAAYFPGHTQPYVLRIKQSSARDDVAVCALDVPELPAGIPALPLDSESDAAAVGKAVVLMGYPSGPDRILASLPDEDANNIKQRFGSSVDVLVGRLAELNLIKPLTTQGHITDYEAHRIIYDARTAEGGSGAPLFGQSGRVIGVNFAIFTEMQDANFAVPVRYVITLLQRAGWKPAAPDADAAANTNTPPKDARTNTAATNQGR